MTAWWLEVSEGKMQKEFERIDYALIQQTSIWNIKFLFLMANIQLIFKKNQTKKPLHLRKPNDSCQLRIKHFSCTDDNLKINP